MSTKWWNKLKQSCSFVTFLQTQGFKGLICRHITQCTYVIPWNYGKINIKLVCNTTCRQSYLKKEIHQKGEKKSKHLKETPALMVTIWSDEKRNIIGSNISDKINELKQRDPYAASIYLLKVNIRNTRKRWEICSVLTKKNTRTTSLT